MIEIRKEIEKDYAEVFRLVASAFENEAEARLVEKLRKIPHISLVAVLDGKIVGHICFSPVSLENDETVNFWGLAPMAVLPEFQNQGIGIRLVNEGLRVCSENGFEAVFVLGHSNYYPRFDFETAKLKGFSCEYPSPDESFMVLELVKDALKGKGGLIKYSPEFAEF